MAKRTDSVYLPGDRGSAWVKLKFQLHQEVVIIGVRESDGGGVRSLLAAVPDEDGELRYAGRVGSGFSQSQLSQIQNKLSPLRRKTPPTDDVPKSDASDARWVTPKLVAEVSIAGRTRTGKLRHAVWRGWREDKEAGEVRWEI